MNPPVSTAQLSTEDLLRDLLARAEARAETAESQVRTLDEKVQSQDKLIAVLMQRVTELVREMAAAQSRPEQLALELELKVVQRRLDDLNRDHFGSTTERRGRPEGSPKKPKPPRKKQTGHGPTPQPKLPRDLQLHLISEAELTCPCCEAGSLEPWAEHTMDSEEVTVVERTFRITVHMRQAYRCAGCGHKDMAPGPERFIPGGRYSPEFAVAVAADKYVNAQPLASQVREMADQNLTVTTQTLWDQLHALYILLLPSYLMLHKQVLDSDVVFADESTWRLMKRGGTKKWWVWLVTDGRRAFFQFSPTRGKAAALELLGDYDGVVMADRYSVYKALEKALTKNGGQQLLLHLDDDTPLFIPTPDYKLAVCWMHGRRGFVKADRHGEAEAATALDLIAGLYAIEARAREQVAHIEDKKQRAAALIEVLGPLRDQESRPIVDELRQWMDRVVSVPGLPLDRAVEYLGNGWTEFTRFLDDGRIPLDNGLAERVIRGVVLGRKVYAGSRSERGTLVAALFYSLVASCRLEGVDPRAYMNEAARRAIRDRQSVFLPEDFAAWSAEKDASDRHAIG